MKLWCQQPSEALPADTSTIHRGRLNAVIIGGTALTAGTMIGLYYAWYKDFPRSSFHFHNDFHYWNQMDKGGHIVSSYYIGMIGYESLRWAGVDKKKSTWYGGMFGSVYLATIEIMDGFSEEWGASVSDMAANLLGSGIFVSQQLLWDEQRMILKYSYHPTEFPDYRPDLFGTSSVEKMFKDYNGITYWLSANPNSFGAKFLPSWFNVAFGYGSTGLTGGSENVSGWVNGIYVPEFDRVRQYFLSFDVDLTRIETGSSTLNLLLKIFGFIKIPFPTLEIDSNKKVKFHPLYF